MICWRDKRIKQSKLNKAARRQFIQRFGLVAGSAAAASILSHRGAVSVALAYAPRSDTLASDGQLFSRAQLAILQAICQQVIPTTDTPGAADVDVHGFIDNQLKHCHPLAQQQSAQQVLDKLNDCAVATIEREFVSAKHNEQLALLQALEAARDGFSEQDQADFKLLKQLVVFGYFTSEAGATQALRFDPYPGGFKGSVPFDEVGRAWFRH